MPPRTQPSPKRLSSCPWILAILVTAPLFFVSCGQPPAPKRPVVLASVPPLAWFVESLANDWVDVVVLVPPGANPSQHEPSMETMRALAVASLWFKVGHPDFPFEAAWLDRLLGESQSLTVVSAAPEQLSPDAHDPHVWLSPVVAVDATQRVATALAELLPEHAAVLEQRAAALVARIQDVDRQVTDLLSPYHDQAFFVFHPAWGWFAEHVGIEQVAIEHDHKLPSLFHLSQSISLAQEAGCRAVFVQPQFSATAAQEVAAAVGAEIVTI
ncbi:MAG: zinc transport system substrate-binding protein, partial [Pseudohongiellaceae bacterium]